MRAPLAGLLVVDLSRILAGPLCTQTLADLGARVIKVERPGKGDATRGWGPPFEGASASYFHSANRGKESVALDLQDPRGLALARRLAGLADVVVQNFKPGAAERLGLDAASLRALAPRLVCCTISGFGRTGPDARRTGYDALIQATGGMMSVTGEAGRPPVKVGVAVADVLAAKEATTAILAALWSRERAGEGATLDVALQDALVAGLVNQSQAALATGVPAGRLGSAHPQIVPYQSFEAADGWFTLAAGSDAQFRAAARVAGLSEVADDPRFADNPGRVTNRDELVGRFAHAFRERDAAHWVAALTEAGVPAGPIRELPEVLADPQLTERGMVLELPHPELGSLRVVGGPIRSDDTPLASELPPPELGAHTDAVLRELLGLDGPALDRLRDDGVIESR